MHVHDLNVLTIICSLNGDDTGTVFISLHFQAPIMQLCKWTAKMHKSLRFYEKKP